MSDLYYTIKDVNKWICTGTAILNSKYNNEKVYNVIIGYVDCDYAVSGDISIYIRETIYNNLMSGKYRLAVKKSKASQIWILDENLNEIPQLKNGYIY